MRTGCLIGWLCTFVCVSAVHAADTYEGTWQTTNRRLDGAMTCVVTDVGNQKWRGRFHGVWQGVPFDYTVDFAGPSSALRGTARIDGADYAWSGNMTGDSFKGQFGGNRYTGHFDLARKPSMASRDR